MALAFASLAWTSIAVADNPHGTPPGQQQKASVSTSTTASASVSAGAKAQAKGHVNAHAQGHSHAASSVSATAAPQAGVKPSSTTSHDTHAAAASTSTKLYGNGQTAGQIAMAAGVSGQTLLHGPGNSQPHKVLCGPHEVDVHALKHKANACSTSSPTASTGTQASVSAAQQQTAAQQQVAATATSKPSTSANSSGVLGAKASTHAKKKSSGGGLLGATARLGRGVVHAGPGKLAFTGLDLWIPVALGLALIATGFGLVRRGKSLA